MMRKILFAAAAAAMLTSPAFSAEFHYKTYTPAEDQELLVLGVGQYEVADDEDSVEGRVEFRGNHWWAGLGPLAGVNFNADGAVYAFAGVYYDLFYGNIYLTPTFGIGYYEEGSSKDLGGPLEFRSGLEAGYKFDNGYRLGATISHLSNAGIYDRNPGSESATINFSIPFSAF